MPGERMQNDIWRGTLRNLSRNFGVAEPEVRSRIVCVDYRRQWSNWKTIWNNAAIGSTLYATAAPARWVARSLGHR